jgi:Flp pilus assembly protein TadD
MMELPLSGNIKDISLVKILVFLNRNRKTGTLAVTTPSVTKKIYFDEGDVIFASSTYEDDRLGEMLLKAGKITVEQYDKSVEILKATRNKRQGAILVELGYLTPKDLFWGVKFQVKEIIYSMFLVEDGTYEFFEGELPTQEVITLKMSIGNLIYTGVNKIVNWTRIRNEMPHIDSAMKLSEDPLSLFQNIELSQQDRKILSLIDGKRTIREVIDSSWMGSFDALKVLYVLWAIGMIEAGDGREADAGTEESDAAGTEETEALSDILKPLSVEEATLLKKVDGIYERLGSMTMAELLEVTVESDSETIKKNYYRLAKEFHPDRYFNSTDPSVKMKLTAIFDTLTEAYSTLKDERLRREYFASPAAPTKKEADNKAERASEQFREGVADFKKGNFWGAIDRFKWAAKLEPENANYWSYLSLACSKVPGRIKEAEEALLTALKLEPFNADFHSHLGLVYMKAGLKKRANASFQKALKIDPKNEKARKGLEQTKE